MICSKVVPAASSGVVWPWRDAHVALRAEIIDFIRPDFSQQADERSGIRQIAVMQKQLFGTGHRRCPIQIAAIPRGRAADNAVDFIPF